jgi:glycerophosphoryl diester phosphodiesterase
MNLTRFVLTTLFFFVSIQDVGSWLSLGARRSVESDFQQAIPLLQKAAEIDPNSELAQAWLASTFHLQRRLDEAAQHYAQLLRLAPIQPVDSVRREAILRFAPRVFQVSTDPFPLKDVVAIHHPDEPLIAYHFFWEDDIDFPDDNDPCDHELVWVQYDASTGKIIGFYTYFHGRILSSPAAIQDAHRHAERPIVNVQWGKHGSLPYGWEDLQIQADPGDVESSYLDLQRPVRLEEYNRKTYQKLNTEGRRLAEHPLGRSWPKRFEGTWTDFVTFGAEVDIRGRIEQQNAMVLSRWNNAALQQHFLRYNFRPKTEWPDRPIGVQTLDAQLDRRVGSTVRPVTGQTKIVAHRGAVFEAPENTMPAIKHAISVGATFAEIDLRYTAEGEVVLMHDETVDRTTNGSGPVSSMKLPDIRKLDAGVKKSREFAGTRVPTLREVIENTRGRIQLYLDLKEVDPTPVVQLVRQLNVGSMVYFRPYSHRAMRSIVETDPTLRVLFDLEDWIQFPGILPILRRTYPTAALSSGIQNWTPELLAEARSLGLATFVNVLGAEDTPENLRRALDLRFDYIQTDHQIQLQEMIRNKIR